MIICFLFFYTKSELNTTFIKFLIQLIYDSLSSLANLHTRDCRARVKSFGTPHLHNNQSKTRHPSNCQSPLLEWGKAQHHHPNSTGHSKALFLTGTFKLTAEDSSSSQPTSQSLPRHSSNSPPNKFTTMDNYT